MWQTPKGIRVLRGDEACLFQTGVLLLHDQIEDFGTNLTGIPNYDQLSPEEKCIALATVAKGLLLDTQAVKWWHDERNYMPTIAAVYEALKTNVHVEISLEGQVDIRQKIKAAYLQVSADFGEYDTVINLEQDNYSEWHARIDVLAAEVVVVPEYSLESPDIDLNNLESAELYLQELRNEKEKNGC